jgi:hypothetical protein
MKEYNSISRDIQYGEPVYAFDKLDGSNIRAEWSRKRKEFYKYGSRTQLIDERHPFIGDSVGLIRNKYQDELCRIFKDQRWHKVVAFFEYWSPNSFAGYHQKEPHEVTLIDVNLYKHGIMNPDEFIDLFGHTGIPRLVYRGNMNHEVEQQIREGKMPGVTFEGVVCKIKVGGKTLHPKMFKVKTFAWLQKLKNYCKGDDKLYEQLV